MKQIVFKSPLGRLLLKEKEGYLISIDFISDEEIIKDDGSLFLNEAKEQILAFLDGKRVDLDLPHRFEAGTIFQQKVWNALKLIPYGTVTSYQAIAIAIGHPKACRAVGGANNANPLPILIPCHRVIGKNGKLVGYGGGLDKKIYLLALESKNNE